MGRGWDPGGVGRGWDKVHDSPPLPALHTGGARGGGGHTHTSRVGTLSYTHSNAFVNV